MNEQAADPALVGPTVRVARQHAGVSLRELARQIGVSPATLSAVETGRAPLTVDRLRKIASVLGVRPAALVDPSARPSDATSSDARPSGASRARNGAPPSDPTSWRDFAELDLDPVLRSAIAAFVRTGYHGATVRQVATGAGMSVPGLYHHYPSKQRILVAILDVTMADLRWRVVAARDEGGSATAQFARIVEALALFHTLRRDLAFIGASEMRSLDEPDRSRIAGLRNEVQYLLDAVVDEATRQGEFTTAHARDAARAVSTMCTSLPTWFRSDGPSTAQAVAREYAAFALAMMRDTASLRDGTT